MGGKCQIILFYNYIAVSRRASSHPPEKDHFNGGTYICPTTISFQMNELDMPLYASIQFMLRSFVFPAFGSMVWLKYGGFWILIHVFSTFGKKLESLLQKQFPVHWKGARHAKLIECLATFYHSNAQHTLEQETLRIQVIIQFSILTLLNIYKIHIQVI